MKRSSPIAYAFFFVATLLGVGALFLLCDTMEAPKGWITLAISLATAEWLIRRHGFEATGVESALWLGGLFAWIAGLPSQHKPEAWLAFAAAAAIAGARVRNPWFGALATVLVVGYLDAKHLPGLAIVAVAQGIALAAAFARTRTWRLASTDRLFGAIAIAASLNTYKEAWPLYLLGGAVMLAIALRNRDRMLLISGGISLALACFSIGQYFDYPVEGKMIAAGLSLVALSLAVARLLRGRERGIVATPVPEGKYEQAATLAATFFAAPQQAAPETESTFQGGGGQSGGGGATETF